MQNKVNRASQFLPFDSLEGFFNMLSCVERGESFRFEDSLNGQIKGIQSGDTVMVQYYDLDEYIEVYDIVKKVDFSQNVFFLSHSVIPFSDIIGVKKIEK